VDFPAYADTSHNEPARAGSLEPAEGTKQLNEGSSSQDGGWRSWSKWKAAIRDLGEHIRAAWRSALGWLRAKASQSPFATRAIDAFQKQSPRARIVGAAVLLLLVVFVLLGIFSIRGGAAGDPQRQAVTQWLDAQVAGHDGSEFLEPRPGSF